MYRKLIFELSKEGRRGHVLPKTDVPPQNINRLIPTHFLRETPAELPQLAENEVVRHFVELSQLNHHVDKAFYPLGSCTMKYNPKINDQTASLKGFAALHPDQPQETAQGALRLMYELQQMLMEISGFSGITLQPAAGAHGELVGLLLIKKYFDLKNEKRSIILVPDSAHGTNPASAVIAGFEVKSVKSTEKGLVDLQELKANLNTQVAGIMLTNPSTLGIFESQISKIREMMDEVGALMYMDGANMNALFGLVRPGDLGFDVMHLNLHKSFSTPHGGGGPGSGPVAVNDKLKELLPVPVIERKNDFYCLNSDLPNSIGKIQAFFGNFGVMVRAYTYLLMVGSEGIGKIAEHAIVNANYLRKRLAAAYELGYDAPTMHEFVLSAGKQKKQGAKALDIAKRLLDFGIHPPTVYFPLIVKEALMIEPTETESREMLDVFAETMLNIAKEAEQDPQILQQAPHNTPVKRLDEAAAARKLNVNFYRNN